MCSTDVSSSDDGNGQYSRSELLKLRSAPSHGEGRVGGPQLLSLSDGEDATSNGECIMAEPDHEQKVETATRRIQSLVRTYIVRKRARAQKEDSVEKLKESIERFENQHAELLRVVKVTEHVLTKMFEAQSKGAVPDARVHEAYDRHKDAT